MSLTERFASALRHHREMCGLSQEQLAERSGLDRTYVSQLERALKSPTLTTIQKLSQVLGVDSQMLLREPRQTTSPRVPQDYLMRNVKTVPIARGATKINIPSVLLTSAINTAHDLIDELYGVDLDIASILGLRNLSAFIGELVAASIVRVSEGQFRPNPHQDGYPDLLLMDDVGIVHWNRLHDRLNDKAPFSPFAGGGVEVKATCGSIPTPEVFRKRNLARPEPGKSRMPFLTGYDWKAHHRGTNNLVGVLWDFLDSRPRIAAMFYSGGLEEADWGTIVQPRDGGGRTTSVSIMSRSGIGKMYEGWLCVHSQGGYAPFLNRKNRGTSIPEPDHI